MPSGHHEFGFTAALIALLQAIMVPAISTLVLLVTTSMLGVPFSEYYVALAVVSSLLCVIFMRGQMAEDWSGHASGWSIASKVTLAWIGVFVTLLLIGYATKVSAVYSRRALFAWFLVSPPLFSAALILLRNWYRRRVIHHGKPRTAIIAGVNAVSRQLARSIQDRPEFGLVMTCFFDDRGVNRLGDIDSSQLLGRLADIPDYAKKHNIDTVFFAIPLAHINRTKDLIDRLSDTTASLYFVPDLFVFDLIQAKTSDLDGIPVVALLETPFHGWRGFTKQVSDLVLASLMLLFALPGMALIALAVKLTSPGSVIFKQRRYGLDGSEIVVYKFRTMTVSEDGDQVIQAERNDSRLTPIGEFLRRHSLDELPQIINVLQGRMSVVGPRPHAVAHNEHYRRLIRGYMGRHKVTPGITGLAQISGYRGETANIEEMEKRVQYDLEYLRHWSLALDAKIIFKTLTVWFRDKKAY
jgi:putative colanic acid biosynthesis UDP-glucose lipid carrier transferase